MYKKYNVHIFEVKNQFGTWEIIGFICLPNILCRLQLPIKKISTVQTCCKIRYKAHYKTLCFKIMLQYYTYASIYAAICTSTLHGMSTTGYGKVEEQSEE